MVVVAFFFKNKYQGFIKAFLKVIKKSKIQSNNAIVNMNVRSYNKTNFKPNDSVIIKIIEGKTNTNISKDF